MSALEESDSLLVNGAAKVPTICKFCDFLAATDGVVNRENQIGLASLMTNRLIYYCS